MPDIAEIKLRLKKLSQYINEKVFGNSEFYILQFDETKEYQGFFYAS